MRKITEESVKAFLNDKAMTKQNMLVAVNKEGTYLYLHANKIAEKKGNTIKLFSAGWYTNTTKERLNGILDLIKAKVFIRQVKSEWFICNRDNKEVIPFKEGYIVVKTS